MAEFEKEPEEGQEEEFDELESFGESNVEEYSGLKERLGPKEEIKMMSTARLRKKDKSIICLTDKRVLIFHSDKSKLLGKRNRFEDIKLGHIHDIKVEERKDFDMLKIETDSKEREIMTPEGKGVEISGLIRDQQDIQERDPADQLERIGREKEKGNISQEEYEEKKDDLMDRI
jgi:hypothetical protein